MTVDFKNVAIFLPFFSAGLVGLTYTMNSRIVTTIPLSTYVFLYCVTGAAVMLLLHVTTPIKMDLVAAARWPIAGFIAVAVFSSITAWLMALITIREVSATYAAIGEVSYPFFTALFTYFLFRSHELTRPMAIGGVLILMGSVIIISDKLWK